MSFPQDENDDLASSADQILDDQADTLDEADPSPAAGEDEHSSIARDVVDSVVAEREEPVEAASPAEGDNEDQSTEEVAEPDDEEFKDVPFHQHPRFQALIKERNELRGDAENYRNVQTFLDDSGLAANEAAEGLSIMGLAKTNPGEAWAQIKPWVQSLLIASGEVLSPELKARVEAGEMSPEAAHELSKAQMSAKAVQAQTEQNARVATQRQEAQNAADMRGAVAQWERERHTNDPNYAAKEQAVLKELTWIHSQEGMPKDAAGVKDQLTRAYDHVNSQLAPPPAPPRPKTQVTPIRAGQITEQPNVTQSMSTLDIIKAHTG